AGRQRRPAGRVASGQTEVAPAPAARTQRRERRLAVVVAGEALVQPRLLELVRAHERVPELVAGLVDGHALGALERRRREAAGAAGEQRRVLHAARARRPGRVDHRDLRVRVGRGPGAVVAQRDPRRLDVTLAQVRVLRLQQQADGARRITRVLEAALAVEEAPAGRPGEVVHVLLHEAQRLGAVAVFPPLLLAARPA